MKQLVIGVGEIGMAIKQVLDCDGYDEFKNMTDVADEYDVLHICFPYGVLFEMQVNDYKSRFNPILVVVHSTVPIGTCDKLKAVSSPVRGVHPHLFEGVKTFVKFFGGEHCKTAARLFSDVGVKTQTHPDARTTEAMKLWDTTMYGFNIILEKAIYEYCEKYNLDFDIVYTQANQTYNDGYRELDMPQFQKYVLGHRDGKIGGHCVIPNCDLLDSWVGELIKDKNNQ